MSVRNIKFVPSEYYHIYNRGNSKQRIFLCKKDYERFLALLYVANTDERFNFYDLKKSADVFSYIIHNPLVAIGAYCLMPNHFHILITPLSEEGLSKFMQKLSTAYSMYFNEKYKRTGSLFEGKFKAQLVQTDRQLKYTFSYIHLNPVKIIDSKWKENGIKNLRTTFTYLRTYPYSSLLDYLQKERKEGLVLSTSAFPQYFNSGQVIEQEIIEWLSYGSS